MPSSASCAADCLACMELAFFSPADMAVVMAVALVVFGPKRLPEVGRQLGSFVREMRKTVSHLSDAMEGTSSEFRTILHGEEPNVTSRRVPGDLMRTYDQRDEPPTAATREDSGDADKSAVGGNHSGATHLAGRTASESGAEGSEVQ